MFRKFMVSNYIGQRWYKIPFTDRWASSYRGGPINMLCLLIVGLLVLLEVSQDITGTLGIMTMGWIIWTGFPLSGYSYFELYPIKWEELSDEQKWYYGNFVLSGDSVIKLDLTIQQLDEYIRLNKKFRLKFNL